MFRNVNSCIFEVHNHKSIFYMSMLIQLKIRRAVSLAIRVVPNSPLHCTHVVLLLVVQLAASPLNLFYNAQPTTSASREYCTPTAHA